MNANEILTAAAATLEQRGKDYDQPEGERSMGRIVDTFNALTGEMLTEAQGWQFMACLKLVRMQTAADPTDSAVDCAAYAALAGEALSPGVKNAEDHASETENVVVRWVPRRGERYWTFDVYTDTASVRPDMWSGDLDDRPRFNAGRVFKTREEAQAACDAYPWPDDYSAGG